MSTHARNFLAALRTSVLVAASISVFDLFAVLTDSPRPRLSSLAYGAASGLFLALIVGLVAGTILGTIWSASLGPRAGDEAARAAARSMRRWLWEGAPRDHHRRIGAVFGGLLLLLVFSGLSFFATREMVVGMARPHFIALAVLAAHLVLFALMVALFPAASATARAVVGLVGRVPGVRLLVSRALYPLGALALLVLTGAGYAIVKYREVLSYLPWEAGLRALIGLTAALALRTAWRLGRRRLHFPRAVRVALIFAFVALLATTGVIAIGLSPTQMVARTIATERILAGKAAVSLVGPSLDFDGDGQLSFLGGGDCAPFDARIHQGAIDIPNNGVDEDCEGGDLDTYSLDLWGKWDYPVNRQVPKQPVIILITNDAFAAHHMSGLGYERDTTPNMDRFAKTSALFTEAFTQGPSTRLSFPSIFTSKWDSQIPRTLVRKHPYPMEPQNLTIAEILSANGYDTVAVLPATYFLPSRWKGLLQGFTQIVDKPARAWDEKRNIHTAPLVTEAALDVIHQDRKRPLFLWVHYFDAHSPHRQPKGEKVYGKSAQDAYDAELRFVDRYIGELLDGIEKQYMGDAFVILTGDHGNGFDLPRHKKNGYGQDLNTVTLNVPLMFHGPFVSPRRIDRLATTLDIVPTIVNLLGLKGRYDFQGVSLVPSLLDRKDVRPEVTFHQFYIHESLWKHNDPLRHIALRTPKYNLIIDREKGEVHFYNWADDYYEKKDLADMNPPEMRDLRKLLMIYLYHVYGKQLDPPKERRGVARSLLRSGKLRMLAHRPTATSAPPLPGGRWPLFFAPRPGQPLAPR